MSIFTVIFLIALFLSLASQCYLFQRHMSHIKLYRPGVPEAFEKSISLDEHQKAADYAVAKGKTSQVDLILGHAILLIWTLGGGLEILDKVWRDFEVSEIWTGIGFILSMTIISSLLDIPLSIYKTFRLEERFGFNKTTVKTFITDMIKNTLLLSIIGVPMLYLILWIMQTMGALWWLYVWISWFAFSLFMMWAYPAFIAPLFNKFKPLENETLKERIVSLLTRNGFASQGIFVMDGSSRSSHGNAYFTGMGSNKRIVFFDTLIDNLTHEEIEAVLAHELGHFKRNHVKKRIALMAGMFLLGLAIIGWLINLPWFFNGLGVSTPSTYIALTLFMMVSPVFTFFLTPLSSFYSRKHEFEADDFAAEQTQSNNLITALVKLYKENANTLTPDPLFSAVYDSHPPAPLRIAHLEGK
jgi:STE24 endopeptidase